MTARKDLKRRIRARQAETGESYVTARRHVVGAAPVGAAAPVETQEPPRKPAFHVDELLDVTDNAVPLGFRCRVTMTRTLADRVESEPLLRRLRDTLDATRDDPALERMRAVLLHGERAKLPLLQRFIWIERTKQFLSRARAGIGGVSEQGDMLALSIDGKTGAVMVLAYIGWLPRPQREHAAPRVSLSAIGEAADGLDSLSVLFVS